MQQAVIRKARLEDVPQMVACIDAAYAVYRDSISDLPPVSEGLEEDIARNQVWLMQLDGTVVGVVVLVAAQNSIKLANLAVHPSHGGKGLGKRLIDHAEQVSREQGFAALALNTHIEMSATQRLYKRLGWKETGRSGVTVMMSKDL